MFLSHPAKTAKLEQVHEGGFVKQPWFCFWFWDSQDYLQLDCFVAVGRGTRARCRTNLIEVSCLLACTQLCLANWICAAWEIFLEKVTHNCFMLYWVKCTLIYLTYTCNFTSKLRNENCIFLDTKGMSLHKALYPVISFPNLTQSIRMI